MKKVSITKMLEDKKIAELNFGMVVKYNSKTCLIVEKRSAEYPVLLIAIDNFSEYEEFESFNALTAATNNIEVIGELSL